MDTQVYFILTRSADAAHGHHSKMQSKGKTQNTEVKSATVYYSGTCRKPLSLIHLSGTNTLHLKTGFKEYNSS